MEELILEINSPANQGNPQAINRLGRQIQQLQAQSLAWETSMQLLDRQHQDLQFYGALTLEQKVNADWDTDQIGQNRDQFSSLLEHLVTRFIRLSTNDSDVVVNKLSTVLGAIFTKSNAAWAHPCRHVLACILAGRYVPESQVLSVHELLISKNTISGAAMKSVLRLALSLQEIAATKTDTREIERVKLMLSNNMEDVWRLLVFNLEAFGNRAHPSGPIQGTRLTINVTDHYMVKVLGEVLQQIPLWAKTIPDVQDINPDILALATMSIQMVLQLLHQPESVDLCIPCLASLQANSATLLAKTVPEYVSVINQTHFVQQWIEDMLVGEYGSEAATYIEFLDNVFSQADFAKDLWLKDEAMLETLAIIEKLIHCKGAAMVEDEVCQPILDFVTAIAEGYSDWSEPSTFDDELQSFLRRVCLAVLKKCQLPSSELDAQTNSWDEDDWVAFEDYRFSASDFFQTAFGILGPTLAQEIASAISVQQDWSMFEAGMFVLTSLSDSLSNEPERCDPYLNQVFSSRSWQGIVSADTQIPSRVCRISIKLLGETTSYLQRNSQHLLTSLNFLFRCLQIRSLSREAARAILNLCDSQRSFLVQALPDFLQTLSSLQDLSLSSSCKLITSISALIQALPSEHDKISPINNLLKIIQNLEATHTTNPPIQDNEIFDPLFDRMSMLAAMAKGLQSPADTPINLDAPVHPDSDFWTTGRGQATQQNIISMLADPWNNISQPNTSLVSQICDFLKAGFKEQHPTATKFSSDTSTQLLTSLIHLNNPNLDSTLGAVSCFLASSSPDQHISNFNVLLSQILTITQQSLQQLSTSPEFSPSTAILDFLGRAFPKYGIHILTTLPETMPIFLDYAVILLRSSDTLPRREAASFFSTFLEYSPPFSTVMQNQQANLAMTTLLNHYSANILGLTIHLLAGQCARSEIEVLAQLLRAFVKNQSQRSKQILGEAMRPEAGVLSHQALDGTTLELRMRFVRQVEGLRGGRKTNEIVRQFWGACRGGQYAYLT